MTEDSKKGSGRLKDVQVPNVATKTNNRTAINESNRRSIPPMKPTPPIKPTKK